MIFGAGEEHVDCLVIGERDPWMPKRAVECVRY